jgi:hypothetical protein
MNVSSKRPESRLSFLELLRLEQCFLDGKSLRQAIQEVGCSHRRAVGRYAEFRQGLEVMTEKQFQEICRIAGRRNYVQKAPVDRASRHYTSDFELPAGRTGL